MESMNLTTLALGASAVLALIILGKNGQPFRDKWETENGKVHSLRKLPVQGESVPFQLIKDNPILPVLLDGDEHLTCWIVDTGYGFSAVDVRLAERLRLPKNGRLSVQTLQTDDLQATTVPRGFIFDLETGQADVEIPPHSAVIRDLPNTLESTHGTFSRCLKPGGILGITFLQNFVTRLDYVNQTLTFFDPERFVYRGSGMRFDGWLEDEHYFLIPVVMDGILANMALDTGAFSTIMTKGFLDKYKKEKGYGFGNSKTAGENGSTVRASFSESPIELRSKTLRRAEIGTHLMNGMEVLFPEKETPGLLETSRFSGLLGYNVLKNFIIYLIYKPTPYVILEAIQ